MKFIRQIFLAFVTILVTGYFHDAIGANILIAHPATTIFVQSHIRFQGVLGRDLVKRGHRVVILSNSIIKSLGNSEENYSDMITLNLPFDEKTFMQRSVDFFKLVTNPDVTLNEIFTFSDTTRGDCKYLWNDTIALEHLKEEKFDLMLMNPFGQCVYLLHCYLDIPFIVFMPAMRFPTFNEDVFRVPAPFSYVPGMMTGFTDHMSLYQRTINFLSRTVVSSVTSHFMIDSYDGIKEEHGLCPGTSLNEIIRKAELWLVNADYAGDFPRPSTPNVIPIGGLMTEPAKPLPTVSLLVSHNPPVEKFDK